MTVDCSLQVLYLADTARAAARYDQMASLQVMNMVLS